MANIELVIKVDERDVDFVRKNFKSTGYSFIPLHIQTEFVSAILNGTPLPKGHGDLVDRGTYCSALEDKIKNWDITSKKNHDKIHGISIAYNICNRLIPIIEADKEIEE